MRELEFKVRWMAYHDRLGEWFRQAWVNDAQVNSFTRQCLEMDYDADRFTSELAKHMFDCKVSARKRLVEVASEGVSHQIIVKDDDVLRSKLAIAVEALENVQERCKDHGYPVLYCISDISKEALAKIRGEK